MNSNNPKQGLGRRHIQWILFCALVVSSLVTWHLVVPNRREKILLFNAVNQGKAELASAILEKNPHLIDSRDPDGYSLFNFAKKSEMVRLLIDFGADPNSRISKSGNTPLHGLAYISVVQPPSLETKEIVQILLEAGADVNSRNHDQATPLHTAAHHDNTDLASELIKNQADVRARNATGQEPLHQAACFASEEMAELLLKNGASVQSQDNRGRQPLHLACKYCNLKVAGKLIQWGADVNARDHDGRSPFSYIPNMDASTDEELRELLTNHGAFRDDLPVPPKNSSEETE